MLFMTVPNRLRVADIPPRGASWGDIVRFAHAFNDHLPKSYPAIAYQVAKVRRDTGRWQGTLTELRTRLYAEYRTFHHWGTEPEGQELQEMYDLLDAIR